MARIFGLPIVAAIILGILFPYTALSLVPFSIFFLVVLMINAGLTVKWQDAIAAIHRFREVALGLFFFYFFAVILWIPAVYILNDQQYLYGFVFTTLCPLALVAPYFTRVNGADEQLSFLVMVASMILCPIIAPLVLTALFSTSVSLNLSPLLRYMVLLVTAPLIVSMLIGHFLPGLRRFLLRFEYITNILTLSLLIFALFGAARGRININYVDPAEIAALLALVFLQDFGVLVAARKVLGYITPPSIADSLAISLSMKNVAIAAGILLVYDPRASLVPALAFVAHAFLFNFLAVPWLYRRLWR